MLYWWRNFRRQSSKDKTVNHLFRRFNEKSLAQFVLGSLLLSFNQCAFADEQNTPLAKTALDRHQYLAAITYATVAIRQNTHDAEAYLVRGIAHVETDNPQTALADFKSALTLNPHLGNITLYNYRYRAFLGIGDFKSAADDLTKAIALEPKAGSRYKERGQVYQSMGNYRKAMLDFDRAIQLQSNSALNYQRRADCESCLKQYQAALRDYSQAIKLRPHEPFCYGSRAKVYMLLGKLDLAELDRQKANALSGFER
jgi:tetratricopeptide (TPR) repeat protein